MLSSAACRAASFDYLYIEASEGNSSGGHAAIQFDNDVYHFQHIDSGMIRLYRLEKGDFHFLYRFLQNRPIHLSRVDVSEETLDALKEHFKSEFFNQERLFKLLDDLHKDRIFIQYLLKLSAGYAQNVSDAPSVLRLKGAGLFYPEPLNGYRRAESYSSKRQSFPINRVRQLIEQQYGPDFLTRRQNEIESQIKMLAPIDWPDVQEHFAGEKFPPRVYSFADRYLDYLTALFAINVLIEAQPLQEQVFFRIRQDAFKLSSGERTMLMNWRNHLETSLVKSLNSERPDWGYAALVTWARYLAVEESLRSGYWAFIDDFAENSERIGRADYQRHADRIQALINDAQANLNRLRRSAINRPLNEAQYSRMEMAANRYVELLKSGEGIEFRYNGEKALPVKSIGISKGPFPKLSEQPLKSALSHLDTFENKVLDKLKQKYRYDLITRNCVTELFRNVDRALLAKSGSQNQNSDPDRLAATESEKRLGGYVDAAYNFIPFISQQSVRERYNVMKTRDLDSYRNIELARLMAGQNKLLAALKESNTVSGRLYNYNQEDAFFVFFTDNNLLLRPVFGFFNTAAGFGQSLYGAFSWPFDSGKNLRLGATGILMSLPELVFFNMRKGSYKYLSPNLLAAQDTAGF